MWLQMNSTVVDMLATARLARLIHADGITKPFRAWAFTRAYGGHRPSTVPDQVPPEQWPAADRDDPPFVAGVLSCRWCVSVWIAFGVVAVRRCAPRVWDPVARALAASYVTGWLAEHEDA